MIKIGLYFFGSLKSPTGASTVLKSIREGFSFISDKELTFFALDSHNLELTKPKVTRKKVLLNYIKKIIHSLLTYGSKHFLIVTNLYVWLQYHKNAKKVINLYIDRAHETDILFFHDIITSYHFKKTNLELWNLKKKVIVLHTNGEVFKMLFSYYPKLSNSKKTRQYYEEEIGFKTLKDVDKIVLLSDFAKRNFIKIYPDFFDKVEIVHNGLEQIKSKNKSNLVRNKVCNIVTVGTVSLRKGHDLIIEAISLMNSSIRDKFIVNIVGDGVLLEQLKRECFKKNIRNINFYGSRDDVKDILEVNDVFLLASRDEGLPMAIIEAMSMKLPIIATNVGGVSDLVSNNENGFLIEPNDAFVLKEAIEKIIEMSFEDLNLMGKSSFISYEKGFTQEIMIENYNRIFDSLK